MYRWVRNQVLTMVPNSSSACGGIPVGGRGALLRSYLWLGVPPMDILRSKAPLRISFAGGGTDVSPYPEERGGAVLNATIDKYAYATLYADPGSGSARVHSLDFDL